MVRRSQAGSLSRLREANVERVLEVLRLRGSVTQAEIARVTELSAATVSTIVAGLRHSGMVRPAPGSPPGGRAVALSLDPGAGLVAGIDFGNRHRRTAISDLAHDIVAEHYAPLAQGHRIDDAMRDAVLEIDGLLSAAGRSRANLLGVAVGVPGPVDPETGLGSPGILPGWTGVNLAAAFAQAFGVPVVVDNDANLGALGEMQWGAGRGCGDFTYLKVTTGIGAGLVLDGRLYRGVAGTAGEIGHTTIDEFGAVCRCGNRGCLELFAATPALLDLLRNEVSAPTTIRELLSRSEAGDPACRRVVEDAGRHIGVALANLCNLLSPRLIIVGGELATAGATLLQPMRDSLARRAVRAATQRVEVVPGELGDRASVLGALALAMSESGRPVSPAGHGGSHRVGPGARAA